MPDRNVLLQEQASVIQNQLTEWAKEQHILQPGEQIVFTLAIKAVPVVPTVIQGVGPEELLDMKTKEFFTKKRLQDAGVPIKFYWTKMSSLVSKSRSGWGNQHGLPTVRDVVAAGKSRLGDRRDFGEKIVAMIEKVLAQNGIVLPE